jgi:MFS family permease
VLGDLKSRRAVIAFGVGLWSAFTALGATVSRFWQLLACRALVGIGEAGYGPAAQALLAEFFRGKRRAFALAIYSVGMAFGGVLGIWLGGVLAERYGWRAAFVALGAPGFVLAVLASRLREPSRRPPGTIRATVSNWYNRGRVGAREALRVGAPLAWLSVAGAALSGVLDLFETLPRGLDTAVFSACVSAGAIWTVVRLVPVALRGTTEATGVAATAFGDFLQAAGTVLRTPTLIWMFVGGALVTFAVNGLIA